jgi:hypothetical protein
MFNYPLNLKIKYKDDFEYRSCIRKLMKHDKHSKMYLDENFGKESVQDNTDAGITADELDYDEVVASIFLRDVFNDTSVDKNLMALYKSAASVMMSTDENTGFVILLSYDNLETFHKCLCVFYTTNTCANNPYYTDLLEKFKY